MVWTEISFLVQPATENQKTSGDGNARTSPLITVTGQSSQRDIRIQPVQQSYQPQLPLSPHFLGPLIHLEMLSESTPVLTSSPFPLQEFGHAMGP